MSHHLNRADRPRLAMAAILLAGGMYLLLMGLETLALFTVGVADSAVVTSADERSFSRGGKTYVYYYQFTTHDGATYGGHELGFAREPKLGVTSIPVRYLPGIPDINGADATPATRVFLVLLYLVPGLVLTAVGGGWVRRSGGQYHPGAVLVSLSVGLFLGAAVYGVDRVSLFVQAPAQRAAPDEAPGTPAFAFANLKEGGRFAAEGDWVYFAPFRKRPLCRAHPDGSSPSVLLNRPVSQINLIGDRLLFLQFVPGNGNLLFELPSSGGQPRRLFDVRIAEVWVQGDWIYYRPECQRGKIHRARIDGSGREKISEDSAASMAIDQDWIYYVNEAHGRRLYRMRLNGAERERLSEVGATEFMLAGDWLYFRDFRDHRLYRMNRAGGEPVLFLDIDARSFNTDGTWLYYSDFGDDARLYRVALEGGLPKSLTESTARFPHVAGDWLYFGVGNILDMDIYRLPIRKGLASPGFAEPWPP